MAATKRKQAQRGANGFPSDLMGRQSEFARGWQLLELKSTYNLGVEPVAQAKLWQSRAANRIGRRE